MPNNKFPTSPADGAIHEPSSAKRYRFNTATNSWRKESASGSGSSSGYCSEPWVPRPIEGILVCQSGGSTHWLKRINLDGTVEWETSWTRANVDLLMNNVNTANGDVYICNTYYDQIRKFNADTGEYYGLWVNGLNAPSCADTDSAGNVYVGHYKHLRKYDSAANLLWSKYSNYDYFTIVKVVEDNYVLVVWRNFRGGEGTNFNKYDLEGNLLDSLVYPSSGNHLANGFVNGFDVDKCGGIYVNVTGGEETNGYLYYQTDTDFEKSPYFSLFTNSGALNTSFVQFVNGRLFVQLKSGNGQYIKCCYPRPNTGQPFITGALVGINSVTLANNTIFNVGTVYQRNAFVDESFNIYTLYGDYLRKHSFDEATGTATQEWDIDLGSDVTSLAAIYVDR